MTQSNYEYVPIDEIPDCKGKQVYLKIMNSPKVDLDRIKTQAEQYEKKLSEKERMEGII